MIVPDLDKDTGMKLEREDWDRAIKKLLGWVVEIPNLRYFTVDKWAEEVKEVEGVFLNVSMGKANFKVVIFEWDTEEEAKKMLELYTCGALLDPRAFIDDRDERDDNFTIFTEELEKEVDDHCLGAFPELY